MRYLAQRRLEFAAQKLEESQEAVRAIALEAGYESEAAFSRAFKRAFGQPPAVWRREQHDRRRAMP
jgi:AraC-like DNA-binding protein